MPFSTFICCLLTWNSKYFFRYNVRRKPSVNDELDLWTNLIIGRSETVNVYAEYVGVPLNPALAGLAPVEVGAVICLRKKP